MRHDALCPIGRRIEIKFTQGRTVAIRHEPDNLLVLHRARGAKVRVVCNGPGAIAWAAAGGVQTNGQRPISLAHLTRLDAAVPGELRLPLVRPAPI